jgi:tRNA pseudouridine38-40 synthase
MEKYFYLIHIQYLGFRFHGWAKQPNVKTVHQFIDKTLFYVLGHSRFKTLGSSRTDAMVSANHAVFELFVNEPLDTGAFFDELNRNLPMDIRALKIEKTDAMFNAIQSAKIKEYAYFFAFGEKFHPFSAPFMATFMEDLDIALMQRGALLFQGKHNFRKYCKKPAEQAILQREILVSQIEKNTLMQASFFPEISYVYHIHAAGFMRNQIRLMMGQLLRLGRGEIGLEYISETLKNPDELPPDHMAPASGLILNRVNFK